MSKVIDMTKEELFSSLNEYVEKINELVLEAEERYKFLWESYEELDEDHRSLGYKNLELKEENEVLKQEESENQKAYDMGYEDGEQSMQDKANKIIEFYRDNNGDIDVLQTVFSEQSIFGDQILEDIETAYNNIIEYEKKKEQEAEIHVGDEVEDKNGKKYIVRNLDDEYIYLLGRRGVADVRKYSDVSKTGKNYPIDEMLKELENETNE